MHPEKVVDVADYQKEVVLPGYLLKADEPLLAQLRDGDPKEKIAAFLRVRGEEPLFPPPELPDVSQFKDVQQWRYAVSGMQLQEDYERYGKAYRRVCCTVRVASPAPAGLLVVHDTIEKIRNALDLPDVVNGYGDFEVRVF